MAPCCWASSGRGHSAPFSSREINRLRRGAPPKVERGGGLEASRLRRLPVASCFGLSREESTSPSEHSSEITSRSKQSWRRHYLILGDPLLDTEDRESVTQ